MVEVATKLDSERSLSESAPAYIAKMLHLAACVILRIFRSSLRQSLDFSRGQKAYFSTVSFHRKMSIQHNDVMSRSTVILTQLWTSQNIFMQPDGSVDSFALFCRKRLAMSVVFDLFWRWRNEFAGQPHPYQRKKARRGKLEELNGSNHKLTCQVQIKDVLALIYHHKAPFPLTSKQVIWHSWNHHRQRILTTSGQRCWTFL